MKKGFTLIELLAVILILGIIALIAVPQVTNVIGSASRGAAETSGEHYIGAVNTKIGLNKLDSDSSNDINDGVIDISTITVDMTGEPPTSGNIYVENGTVKEADLEINGKPVVCDSKGKCNAYDRYIYYNTSTASHDSNGYAVSYYVKTVAKEKWLNDKPTDGIYARYKLINDEIVGPADICSVEFGFCLSVYSYDLSLKRVLDYFNYDKSTWSYSKTYTSTGLTSVTYDRYMISSAIYCDFGNIGADSEEVKCVDNTNKSKPTTLVAGKKSILIGKDGKNCDYHEILGVSCVN